MAENAMDGFNQQASPEQPKPRQFSRISPPGGTPVFYANNVSFRTTFWDFTMDFGQVVEMSEERVIAQDVATVIMAPQHARVFAEVLMTHIQAYEQQFGPIPRPPEPDTNEGDRAGE